MKKNIPLFYSILISLIVLIGSSFASYQVLQEKKLSIKEEILTRTKSIFYMLEDFIKNENIQEIDSRMENLKKEILLFRMKFCSLCWNSLSLNFITLIRHKKLR